MYLMLIGNCRVSLSFDAMRNTSYYAEENTNYIGEYLLVAEISQNFSYVCDIKTN